MSYAIVFPGQGTQHAAMLPWLEREAASGAALAGLAEALGADWRVRSADAAWAGRNDVAQPLLTGVCLAAWQVVAELLPAPAAVAGYSVGELAAFAAAGILSVGDAIGLAVKRAAVMQACLAGRATGLLSISGASGKPLVDWRTRYGLDVAIQIAHDQCIVGGSAEALAAAQADALCARAQCTRLAVAVASHTPWLANAVRPFQDAVEAVAFEPPRVAVVCNRTGTVLRSTPELRAALQTQIAHPVQWGRCMETLAERRVSCILEVGPASTLSRMWNERQPTIPARSLDEFQAPATAAAWVRERVVG